MMLSLSIRRRLLLLLVTFTSVVWAVDLLVLHYETRRQLESLQDAQLRRAARLLLLKAAHEAREHTDEEERDDGVDDDGAPVWVWHLGDYDRALFFQIFDQHGVRYRAPGMPSSLRPGSSIDFETRHLDGEAWGMFSLWDDAHGIGVQVAEPAAMRREMVASIGGRLLMPGLLALPVLGMAIWFAVGHALRPLHVIATELRQRSDEDLRPIITPTPLEVAPLLDALN